MKPIFIYFHNAVEVEQTITNLKMPNSQRTHVFIHVFHVYVSNSVSPWGLVEFRALLRAFLYGSFRLQPEEVPLCCAPRCEKTHPESSAKCTMTQGHPRPESIFWGLGGGLVILEANAEYNGALACFGGKKPCVFGAFRRLFVVCVSLFCKMRALPH